MTEYTKDIILLVADSHMESTVRGLLARWQALRIRRVRSDDFDIVVHPANDPGCLNKAHSFLRPYSTEYQYALVMFDHEGCGREDENPRSIEQDVTEELRRTGWDGRAETLVISPELESWVWSDSPEVDRCLGWSGRLPDLRQWLEGQNLWPEEEEKPDDPKHALRRALREAEIPFSASIFAKLARSVSVNRCTDRSFLKFKRILCNWLGQE